MKSKFDLWSVVKLSGGNKIAGNCTSRNVAGTNLLRIEISQTQKQPSFRKLFGSSSIYPFSLAPEKAKILFPQNPGPMPFGSFCISGLVKKSMLWQYKMNYWGDMDNQLTIGLSFYLKLIIHYAR